MHSYKYVFKFSGSSTGFCKEVGQTRMSILQAWQYGNSVGADKGYGYVISISEETTISHELELPDHYIKERRQDDYELPWVIYNCKSQVMARFYCEELTDRTLDYLLDKKSMVGYPIDVPLMRGD